jgi:large subunit ribosomal protein L5
MPATEERAKPRLREKFDRDVVPMLMEKFSIKNRMAVPRIVKVGINMGVKKEKESKEYFDEVTKHLALLAGQRPVVTRARKSIAGFKVRENDKVGLKVTLRRDRMWEFLDRLVSLAIPRLRDFRGLSRKAFDGRGNYTLGISEQTVFPEVDADTLTNVQGMDITIVTTAEDDATAQALLLGLGLPFQQPEAAREAGR